MLTWILPQEIERKSFCSDTLEERETLHWLENATLDNQPYLIPDPKTKPRSAADNLCHWTDDLKEDVLACQALVERHGLEILVLDQTRADIGLPVVKVVVPGLRHFWPRFAPGRLYEVPVQLGWLPHQMHEQELNPTPMFL
jgi:ribosomal protein S12 methylthiotransferase accessory factor